MAYIDRDLLLQDISESVVFTVRDSATSPELRGARKIIDRIKSAPTADVVEVVRCKDCTHKIITSSGRVMCKRNAIKMEAVAEWYGLTATNNNHYCSCGERKNGGKEE